jgi:hypothetical protein
VVLFVAGGAAVAACGSGGKVVTGPITVSGTTTIANVKTGALIACKNGAGGKVPPLGKGVGSSIDVTANSSVSSGGIQVVHQKDGSAVVSCTG